MSLRIVKTILWFCVGVAAVLSISRFGHGLGASTALTDMTPWGLWIGFDVMSGVALAAGGFVIAATVYVFHLDRYHGIVRPAVLTAFLGYGAVVVGLLYDLGNPWNLWRPIVNWQPDSALFEVAWCVMLYFTVLSLEVAPVILENTRFQGLYRILKRASLPVVIAGIGLSTLHQSSLGTLMLIMPHRVHPLWYSPLLPLLFFISAIGLGLLMVTAESLVTAAVYRRPPEKEVLSGLGWAGAWVLTVYTVVRVGDLAVRGQLHHLGAQTWESWLFVAELLICAIVPAALLFTRRVREQTVGLAWAAGLVIFGFVLNRVNTSGLSGAGLISTFYFPSWMEFMLSLGIVAAAGLAFFFIIEHFPVYEEPLQENRPAKAGSTGLFDALFGRVSAPSSSHVSSYTLAFILAAAFTVALVPDAAISGPAPVTTPAQRARGGENLLIDGNRDHEAVMFGHGQHRQSLGAEKSCATCHHMNRPYDQSTSCSSCHRDMFLPTDIFAHRSHVDRLGGNGSCAKCHYQESAPKTRETARACTHCHKDLWNAASLKRTGGNLMKMRLAPGYVDALHGSCLGCHRSKAKEFDVAEMGRCAFCHKPLDKDHIKRSRELQGLAR